MDQSLNIFDRKSLLLSMIFLFIIIILAGAMALYVLTDPAIEQAMILTAVAVKISEIYPGQLDWDNLIKASREAMFSKLDRYSTYYQQSQFNELDEEMTGGYSGIGVSVINQDNGLLIMSVRENSPASEIGLLTGDIIIGADSVEFSDISPYKTVGYLRGKENSEVLVKVYRPSTEETFEIKVKRRRLPFQHIPFAGYTPDSIIYIRLLDFDSGASEDLEKALDSLIVQKEAKPIGIILDLRGNPGGLFSEAYQTADLFLDGGVFMVGTEGRSRWNNQKYYSSGKDITNGVPMAIIVDRGSASASEIVAGALQLSGRSILVGDTTFGKGLVQGFVRFPEGDGLKLTISRYYFEGPIYLNDFDSSLNDIGHGLPPDFYLNMQTTDPFIRELEMSLALQNFAVLHQDEIIIDYRADRFDDSWIYRFHEYTKKNKFTFKSLRTYMIETMKKQAVNDKSLDATISSIDSFLKKTYKEDEKLFIEYKDYIKYRILQIAFERKYGTYSAYKDVLLLHKPEIKFTTGILLGKTDE